jgi:hypothetical protein
MFLALAAVSLVATELVMLGKLKGSRWRMERLEKIEMQRANEGRA